MMQVKGLEVIDIGVDVPAERFIEAAIEKQAQIICCSALLTTTMSEIKPVIEAAKSAGIRDKVIIMIGGAPVNQAFADSVGADLYRPDAASAAEAAFEALYSRL
jgi:methanogenic corrinoid protein MtbC1